MLDTLTEKGFQEAFQNGGDGGTSAYMREGTTSRVKVADGTYGEFCDFYSISLENFGYHLVSAFPLERPTSYCCVEIIVSYRYIRNPKENKYANNTFAATSKDHSVS